MIIETHAHLDFDQFDSDREEVIKRAHKSGIEIIFNIGTNLETSRFSSELAQKYENIYASVGIHPHDSQEANDENLSELSRLYRNAKVIAIGEIGLDYYKMYKPETVQKQAFHKQLELALELDAPIIIHDRNADAEIIEILASYKRADWKGVFHCFPGDVRMAETVLDLGFHISFTGVITFKNFKAGAVVEYVPLDRLLLETDCPFMAPAPFRGKRNEPAYLKYTAEKMAEIKAISFGELAHQTRFNTLKLFQIDTEIV